jgi:hypothetical protein
MYSNVKGNKEQLTSAIPYISILSMRAIGRYEVIRQHTKHIVETEISYIYRMNGSSQIEFHIPKTVVKLILPDLSGSDRYIARHLGISISRARDIVQHFQDAKII